MPKLGSSPKPVLIQVALIKLNRSQKKKGMNVIKGPVWKEYERGGRKMKEWNESNQNTIYIYESYEAQY